MTCAALSRRCVAAPPAGADGSFGLTGGSGSYNDRLKARETIHRSHPALFFLRSRRRPLLRLSFVTITSPFSPTWCLPWFCPTCPLPWAQALSALLTRTLEWRSGTERARFADACAAAGDEAAAARLRTTTPTCKACAALSPCSHFLVACLARSLSYLSWALSAACPAVVRQRSPLAC